MFKFILQCFLFLLIWLRNKKVKGNWRSPSSFLLGIYLLSAICSIPTLYFGDYIEPFQSKYWFAIIKFSFLVVLFLAPILFFNENKIQKIVLPSRAFLDFFSGIIILLSFYAIFYYAGTARSILSMADIGAYRNMVASGGEYSESGIFNTIASVSSSLYVFALLLFFVYVAIEGIRVRSVLLFISSFSEMLHIFTFAGRDGIVFWLFSFVFLWLLFSKYLQSKVSSKLKRIFVIVSLLMAIPFMMISNSRFGESSYGTSYSLVSYMGQSFVNGPLYFGIDNPPVRKSGFVLINELFHIKSEGGVDLMQIGEWKSWTFGTLVVSLHQKLNGNWGLISFELLALALFLIVMGRTKYTIKLNHIIIYILYFQVLSQGVFYFRQFTRGGNLFILLCLLGAFFSTLLGVSERSVVLYPSEEGKSKSYMRIIETPLFKDE